MPPAGDVSAKRARRVVQGVKVTEQPSSRYLSVFFCVHRKVFLLSVECSNTVDT